MGEHSLSTSALPLSHKAGLICAGDVLQPDHTALDPAVGECAAITHTYWHACCIERDDCGAHFMMLLLYPTEQ